jgi:hypothetical protein
VFATKAQGDLLTVGEVLARVIVYMSVGDLQVFQEESF